MHQGIKTAPKIHYMWGDQKESGILQRKWGIETSQVRCLCQRRNKKIARQLLWHHAKIRPEDTRRHAESHSVCRKQRRGQPLLTLRNEGTRRERASEGHNKGSQCSHKTKALGNNPKGTSTKRRTSTPIHMGVQTQEGHQDQTSVPTQGISKL